MDPLIQEIENFCTTVEDETFKLFGCSLAVEVLVEFVLQLHRPTKQWRQQVQDFSKRAISRL